MKKNENAVVIEPKIKAETEEKRLKVEELEARIAPTNVYQAGWGC
jgi:hypothetical protein